MAAALDMLPCLGRTVDVRLAIAVARFRFLLFKERKSAVTRVVVQRRITEWWR